MPKDKRPKTKRLKPKPGDGDRVVRYGVPRGGQGLSLGNADLVTAIDKHIAKHIGEVEFVFHEIVSEGVHVDIHVISPTAARPFWVLVTSGMSEVPMDVPEGAEDCAYAELIITLPSWWKVDSESFKDDKWYWPVHWMKILARFPHDFDTWLFYGHSVPLADAFPAAGTEFCGVVIGFEDKISEKSARLRFKKRDIYFLTPLPVYQTEMDFIVSHGSDKFFDWMEDFEKRSSSVSDAYDTSRPNTCPPPKKR